jgi:hypothetical protein
MSKTTVLLDFGSGPSTVVLPATVYIRAVSIFSSGTKVILPAPAPVPLNADGLGSVALDDGVVWGFIVSVPSYRTAETYRYVHASDAAVQYADLLPVSAPPASEDGVPTWVSSVLGAVSYTQDAAESAGLSAESAIETLAAIALQVEAAGAIPTTSDELMAAAFALEGGLFKSDLSNTIGVQVAPALGHNLTDPTNAHAARGTLVSIPTYEGSGVAVHPSVYFNPEGWGGKRYWMAFTPYSNSNNQLENASIVCSDDGTTWAVPVGLTNPVGPLITGGYNSDPNLFVDKHGVMYLFWREYIYSTYERHVFKTSADGVNWSAKTLVREDDPAVRRIMAPSYFQLKDGSWVMYGVDILPSPARKYVRSTAPSVTGPWSTPTICTITGNSGVPWHVDMQRVGGEWQALVMSNVSDGAGGELYAMVSQDGLNFTAGPYLITRGTPGSDWDASYYKSCFVPATRYGLAGWDAWVGGATFPASGQIIGRTFIAFDTTAAQVSAAVAALPVAASAKTQEALAARLGMPPWIVADTFARADVGSLTVADTGQTWTASAGTFGIVAKSATPTAATNTRAVISTGVTDCAVTVEVTGPNSDQHWLIARFVDSSNYYRFGIASDGRLALQKVVAGGVTDLATVQTIAAVSGSELTLKCVGSTLTVYINGVLKATITDSTLAGTQAGLQASTITAKFRNFRVRTP